jgi:AbrB family looped-hinge helix DNA binding protein
MYTVKVSPKFQVVIPLEIRQALKVNPGEKMQVLSYRDRIELIPLKKIKKMRGFAKGIDSTIEREPDRL